MPYRVGTSVCICTLRKCQSVSQLLAVDRNRCIAMTTVNAVELCTTQQQQQQQSQTRALCASLYQFFVTEQLCDITLSSGIDKQKWVAF